MLHGIIDSLWNHRYSRQNTRENQPSTPPHPHGQIRGNNSTIVDLSSLARSHRSSHRHNEATSMFHQWIVWILWKWIPRIFFELQILKAASWYWSIILIALAPVRQDLWKLEEFSSQKYSVSYILILDFDVRRDTSSLRNLTNYRFALYSNWLGIYVRTMNIIWPASLTLTVTCARSWYNTHSRSKILGHLSHLTLQTGSLT